MVPQIIIRGFKSLDPETKVHIRDFFLNRERFYDFRELGGVAFFCAKYPLSSMDQGDIAGILRTIARRPVVFERKADEYIYILQTT
jgi:hypothetical protein